MAGGVAISSLRAELEGSPYIGSAQGIIDANAKMAASQGAATVAMDATERKLGTSVTAVERLKQSYIAGYAEAAKFQQGISNISRAFDAGKLPQADFENALIGVTKRYAPAVEGAAATALALANTSGASKEAVKALNDLSTAHDGVHNAAGRMREGLVEVHEFIRGDWKRSIGSAMIELQNFGLMAPIISALKNPFVELAITAVGSLGTIFEHAVATEDRLRSFNVILNTTGASSVVTAAQLDLTVIKLRDMGVAVADTQAAIQAGLRTPGINKAQVDNIVAAAPDLGAALGIGTTEAAGKYFASIAGGVETMLKLGFATQTVTGAEAAHWHEMALSGQQAEAINEIYQKISTTLTGAYTNSLSDASKAMKGVSAAWSDMLDTLSNSAPVQGWLGAVQYTLQQITAGLGGKSPYSVAGPVYHGVEVGGVGGSPTGMLDQINMARQAQGLPPLGSLPNAAGNPFTPVPPSSVSGGVDFSSGSGTISSLVSVPGQYADAIAAAAQKYNIPADLLAGLLASESGFNPGAVSPKGAQGIAQFMPGTAATYGVNTGDATSSIMGAAHYLSDLRAQGGSYQSALTGYVTGNVNSGYQFPANDNYVKTGTLALAQQYDATTGAASAGSSPSVVVPTPEQNAALTKYLDEKKEELYIAGLHGTAQEVERARYEESKAALTQYTSEADRNTAVNAAGNQVLALKAIELDKLTTIQKVQTQGIQDTTAAYEVNEVAGLRAAALATAQLKAAQENRSRILGYSATDVEVAKQQQDLLDNASAKANEAAAKALPALQQQAEATQRLADAAGQGTAAQHEAQLQNEITTKSHNALAAAEAASTDPAIRAAHTDADMAAAVAVTADKNVLAAVAIRDKTSALIHANDVAAQTLQINDQVNANDKLIADYQLQTSLQGQSTDQINQQVILLKARQQLEDEGAPLDSARAQKLLQSTDSLERANIALSQAKQQWGFIDSAVQSVGSTIETDITNNLTAAFDGQKVTSWGTLAHQVLAQIEAQIVNLALIKPAIGSILSLLGLSGAASSFGSFGSLASILGGGGSSGAGAATLTPNANGTFSLSNVASASSLASSGSSWFGAGGSITGAINSFGANLGFAGSGIVNGTGAGAGIFTNLATGATSDVAGSGVAGGLFGGATLSSALGGIGGGFTAGTLLNSVLGGNQTNGMIGSAAGALAGAAIGSIIPGIGTLIGGVLGGAAGAVRGDLFGRKFA